MKTMFDDIVVLMENFVSDREIPRSGVCFDKNGKQLIVGVNRTKFENLYEFFVMLGKGKYVTKFRSPIAFDKSKQCYDIETKVNSENKSEIAFEITRTINDLLREYDIDMKKYLAKEMLEDE